VSEALRRRYNADKESKNVSEALRRRYTADIKNLRT
jgi:hypothetical protein